MKRHDSHPESPDDAGSVFKHCSLVRDFARVPEDFASAQFDKRWDRRAERRGAFGLFSSAASRELSEPPGLQVTATDSAVDAHTIAFMSEPAPIGRALPLLRSRPLMPEPPGGGDQVHPDNPVLYV